MGTNRPPLACSRRILVSASKIVPAPLNISMITFCAWPRRRCEIFATDCFARYVLVVSLGFWCDELIRGNLNLFGVLMAFLFATRYSHDASFLVASRLVLSCLVVHLDCVYHVIIKQHLWIHESMMMILQEGAKERLQRLIEELQEAHYNTNKCAVVA